MSCRPDRLILSLRIIKMSSITSSAVADDFARAVKTQKYRPEAVLFVAAEVEHKFYDVEEELSVLVFFAPAES